VPKLFGDLALACGDGRYPRVLRAKNRFQQLTPGPAQCQKITCQRGMALGDIISESRATSSSMVCILGRSPSFGGPSDGCFG
jgi:hypothetical protein